MLLRSEIEDYRSQLANICVNVRSAEYSRPSVVRESWDELPHEDISAEGVLNDMHVTRDSCTLHAYSGGVGAGDATAESSSQQATACMHRELHVSDEHGFWRHSCHRSQA